MQNIREIIEYFHLIFLEHLGRKIDKRFYTLKGGCNLRFYFQSFRYSEDIDFDVQIIRAETLLKNISTILEARSLESILQTHGLTITNISTPKQTSTTQRWKVALKSLTLNLAVHTKIEFSRRRKDEGILFEAINSAITQHYHLPPIVLSHYDRTSAIGQKVAALAERKVTQTRDIFDLYLLIGNNQQILSKYKANLTRSQIDQALQNLTSISFQDFQSQVITYLSADYQKIYSSKMIWQQIVTTVEKLLLRGNYGA